MPYLRLIGDLRLFEAHHLLHLFRNQILCAINNFLLSFVFKFNKFAIFLGQGVLLIYELQLAVLENIGVEDGFRTASEVLAAGVQLVAGREF